jgi:hypothetical protein
LLEDILELELDLQKETFWHPSGPFFETQAQGANPLFEESAEMSNTKK